MINLKTKIISATLVFLFLVAMPFFAYGESLVKCGNEGQPDCTLGDLLALVGSVIDFILTQLVPAIAVIGVVWAAIIMMTSTGDPGKFETAKRAITYIAIGLAVIYLSWTLVKWFISALGGASWTTDLLK